MVTRLIPLLLLLVLSLFLAPSYSGAQEIGQGRMLSFAELQRLNPDERALYIQGIRDLLVELASQPDSRFSDTYLTNEKKLRAWLELIEFQFLKAEAQGSSQLCSDNPECRAAVSKCAVSGAFVRWNETSGKYECDTSKQAKGSVPRSALSSPSAVETRNNARPDPKFSQENTSAVPVQDTATSSPPIVLSGPRQKFRNISEFAQHAARGNVKGANCRSASLPSISTGETVQWEQLPVCTDSQELLLKKRFEAQKPPELFKGDAPALGNAEAGKLKAQDLQTAQIALTPALPADVVDEAASGAAQTYPVPDVIAPEVRDIPKDISKGVSKQVAQKPSQSVTLPVNRLSACAPQKQVCESRSIISKAYYQANLPCVFAGMISSLANGNRRCSAITEYKIGTKSLKCEVGQTMCNPLLFGTVLGSSPERPICVGRGQAVTEQCGKISNSRDAEMFLNRNLTGIQEKWDEFKNGLEGVCKENSVSAKFHCHECNLMRQRLFELHARLTKDPCGLDLDKSIHQRIKDRSTPTAR